jgi:pyrroline-5-carboxylate reductase
MSTVGSDSGAGLLVVGGGAMGGAVLAAGLRAGVLTAERTAVVEPDAGKHAGLGVRCFVDGAAGAAWLATQGAGAQVLLAVKPQMLADAAAGLGGAANGRVVISILAGTPGQRVRAALAGARVVRAMPNLAVRVGRGCTALCASAGAAPGDDALARRLFGAAGTVVEVEEALMDAFTALAGSGPAYVFYLAEAMTRAAGEMGMDPRVADAVVRETIVGAAALLAESKDAPGVLRAQVTSRGGTTAAATRVLDEAGVMEAWVRAIVAARDRGRELAGG